MASAMTRLRVCNPVTKHLLVTDKKLLNMYVYFVK
jgi:hypothetical protein